ncbi:MAG: hypothetical protein ABIS67_04575 [Candidatus Eisenbacteria bacterium]
MFKTRSKLLIALVLFGALGSAEVWAQVDLVKFSANPSDPIGSTYQPGSNPDAGEPDNPNNGPPRLAMTPGSRGTEPVIGPTSRAKVSLAEQLRWIWVIWMARYLNQTP